MQSEWSACPPDVLQHCMAAQPDYNDNAAAACVKKLWRETFRCGDQGIDVALSPLRPLPAVSYLIQFPKMTSVTLRHLPVWDFQSSWLADTATQNHQYVAVPIWAGTLSHVPPTCSNLTLDHYWPQADAFDTSNLTHSLSQLTNLQQLTVQHGGGADIPVQVLSGQTKLEMLQISGGSFNSALNLVGSLQALPSSITRLQLSGFQDRSEHTALIIENLTHMRCLRHLDVTHSIADLHGMAPKFGGLSMLTKLTLSGSIARGALHDDVLPLHSLASAHLAWGRPFAVWRVRQCVSE